MQAMPSGLVEISACGPSVLIRATAPCMRRIEHGFRSCGGATPQQQQRRKLEQNGTPVAKAAAQGATSPGNDRHHPRLPKAGRVSRGPQVSVTTTTSLRPHAARGGGGGRRNAGSFCNVCFCNVCFCNEPQQRANREHHPSARGRCEGGREGGREEGGGGGDGVEGHGSPKTAMEAQRRPWKPQARKRGSAEATAGPARPPSARWTHTWTSGPQVARR